MLIKNCMHFFISACLLYLTPTYANAEQAWYRSAFDEDSPMQKNWVKVEPKSKHSHAHLVEFTQYPNQKPSETQKQRAKKLVKNVKAQAIKSNWYNFQHAKKLGYEAMFEDDIHFINRSFAYDQDALNPEKPEFLMFYDIDGKKQLVGVMFLTKSRGDYGEQIGGPLTLWHNHATKSVCYINQIEPIAYSDKNGKCKDGRTYQTTPQMLHVWLIDHTDGPFASRMRLTAKEQHSIPSPSD